MTKRVLCMLPNASDNINGFKFSEHEKGMISEPISDDEAGYFSNIEGYELIDVAPSKPSKSSEPPKPPE